MDPRCRPAVALWCIHVEAALNTASTSTDRHGDIPNLYLVLKSDKTPDEVSADFYERQGDDWVFLLGGSEVARLEIDSIVSIAKAPRDLG